MESDSLEPNQKAGRSGRLLCFVFVSAITERTSREPYPPRGIGLPRSTFYDGRGVGKTKLAATFAAASKLEARLGAMRFSPQSLPPGS
jgi:hypothetical protein